MAHPAVAHFAGDFIVSCTESMHEAVEPSVRRLPLDLCKQRCNQDVIGEMGRVVETMRSGGWIVRKRRTSSPFASVMITSSSAAAMSVRTDAGE